MPREHASLVNREGTGLQRYSSVLGAAEINSTFYRRHLPKTFERWRDSEELRILADATLQAPAHSETWCVFDNTASGAALRDAHRFQVMMANANTGATAERVRGPDFATTRAWRSKRVPSKRSQSTVVKNTAHRGGR